MKYILSRGKMSPVVKKAYDTWATQRQRCRDPKTESYPHYGARGIKVEYTSREFIDWFLKESEGRDLSQLSVGRKDHDKNYSLDNIEMVTKSENSSERYKRAGHPRGIKKIEIIDANTGTVIAVAQGQLEASKITGVSHCNICGYCTGRYKKSRNGYTFRYAKECA